MQHNFKSDDPQRTGGADALFVSEGDDRVVAGCAESWIDGSCGRTDESEDGGGE